jgi:biopolymer transport protein ExbB
VPFVEVTNARNVQRSGDGAPVSPSTWHHLAVIAKAGQITLYLDGNQFSTLAAALPTMTGPATVGRDSGASTPPPQDAPATSAPSAPAESQPPPAGEAVAAAPSASAPAAPAATSAGFVGDIDELEIAKVARPAGFIKLAAIEQGPDNGKLISFSVDEETASWLSGYFAVILKSVTLDGWVVIGLLAIMAVISWVVMIDKVSYLNRASKGNKLFLKHFREGASDLDTLLRMDEEDSTATLGGHLAAKDRKTMHAAPLYRLFDFGAEEIRRRFSGNGAQHRVLSPQSIEAIRAVLDSGFVQEAQRLNRMMVMLTIAISGGPFMGLLGTVVGVMITFAAIAATGDVNVNAIAPGIAAALVATVAGLGVAIPALFGYNYLITRIKDMTSEMQVFVDEFITKMAESYHPRPDEPLKMAAE